MQLSKFKLFTMVELIAVISIMAILLSMTIRTMKTDSTTTNVVLLGSTLKYAQVYSTMYTHMDAIHQKHIDDIESGKTEWSDNQVKPGDPKEFIEYVDCKGRKRTTR